MNSLEASASLLALADAIETHSENRHSIVHQMLCVERGKATRCCHLGAAYLSTIPDPRNLVVNDPVAFEAEASNALLVSFPVLSSVSLVQLLDRHLEQPVGPDEPGTYTLMDSIIAVNDTTSATPSKLAQALRAVAKDVMDTQCEVDLQGCAIDVVKTIHVKIVGNTAFGNDDRVNAVFSVTPKLIAQLQLVAKVVSETGMSEGRFCVKVQGCGRDEDCSDTPLNDPEIVVYASGSFYLVGEDGDSGYNVHTPLVALKELVHSFEQTPADATVVIARRTGTRRGSRSPTSSKHSSSRLH